MRTKKRTTMYHCRLDAERIKEMKKMNQKEVNEIMEKRSGGVEADKRTAKSLETGFGRS